MFDKQTYQQLAAGLITIITVCLFLWLGLSSCQTEPHLELPPTLDDTLRLNEYTQVNQQLKNLESIKSLSDQLDSLLVWTAWLKNYHPAAAYRYAETAYRWASHARYDKAQAMGAYYMALLNGRESLYQEGMADPMVSAGISLRIFNRLEDLDWQIRINRLLGNLWYRQEEQDSARLYLQQALSLIESAEPSSERQALHGEVYHSLGITEDDPQNSAVATEYFAKAFDKYQVTQNQQAMTRLLLDHATMQSRLKSYTLADSFFRSSIHLADSLQDRKQLADAYQRYGKMRGQQYDSMGGETLFDDAIRFSRKALSYQQDNAYENYKQMARAYQSHSRINADWRVHVDTALVYYQKALNSARQEGAMKSFSGIAKAMSRLCNWSAEIRQISCDDILGVSLFTLLNSNYTVVLDSITNNLHTANTNELTFERAEQEAVSRRRIRNQWILSGIGLIIIGLIFRVVYLGQQRQRLLMKMQALRAQINPHFMSNSLNAIESLVNLDQKEAASKYLIHFSRLTRRILSSSLNPSTSLSGELETLRHFLALEQLRFRNKLHYQIDLEDQLEPDIIEVPSLILQPYIENAIWHGIKPKPEAGFLSIRIRREGSELLCTVEDDGVGRARAREIKARTVLQRQSVGMKITEQRLEAISRHKGGRVKITDLYDEEGRAAGTRVDIRFPYKIIKKHAA